MMQNLANAIYVGTIDLDKGFINEDNVGNVNLGLLGLCSVIIRSNDPGNVPHFHIISTKGIEICVCIYSNQYFNHGYYTAQFSNSLQKKNLNDWLSIVRPFTHDTKIAKTITKSNWQHIRFLWNKYNPDCKFPDELKCQYQPDYSTMSTTFNPNLIK